MLCLTFPSLLLFPKLEEISIILSKLDIYNFDENLDLLLQIVNSRKIKVLVPITTYDKDELSIYTSKIYNLLAKNSEQITVIEF